MTDRADPADVTRTLLFSDIEGSTELWERSPDAMERAVLWHEDLLEERIAEAGGSVVHFMGDGVFAVSDDPARTLSAMIDAQRDLSARRWPGVGPLRVRMGMHLGDCRAFRGDVFGRSVNLAARVAHAAHGGQIAVTDVVAQRCRPHLRRGESLIELGEHRFRGVREAVRVYSVVAPGLQVHFPRLRSQDFGFADLPAELTPLIGRHELVIRLDELVRDSRLVTLVGPGGIGKSRIAWRVAARARHPFEAGIRYVELSAADGDADVAVLIGSVLRFRPEPHEDPVSALARVLRPLQVLLVLDGCENALEPVRVVTAQLLRACPDLHVLVTSRLALGVEQERIVPIPPLGFPEDHCDDPSSARAHDAVTLFVERAHATDPAFRLTAENLASVAQVCRSLGGVPLAIELAAARVDVEPVASLSRAGTDLAWRLRQGTAPTVAETFEWSLAQLDPEDRVAFSRLGVFAGSFTREMAAVLLADVTTRSDDVIDRLVRSALVTPSSTAPGRVRLLDSAREVARRLGPHDEPTALAGRHASLMLDLALLHGPRIRTADEAPAAEVLRADFADHRLAMAQLMEAGRWSEAAQLLCAVFQFCHFQPLDEANEWAIRVAGHLAADDPLYAQAAGAAALGAWFRGDLGEAVDWGTKATAVAERTREPAFWARLALVDALSYGGGPGIEQLGQHFSALTAASRISPEPFWQINGLGYEVTSLVLFGKLDKARRRADEALALARALGNPDCLHWALHCLGRVLAQDDPPAALVAYEAALDAAMSVDSRWNACLDLIEVASLLRRTGDLRAAAQRLLELLAMLQQSGNRSQLGHALLEASQLLESVGDLDSAASLLLGQRELPRMPTPAQPSPGPDRAAVLRSRLGSKWPTLEARAAATPVHALVTRARTALADVGGR